MSTYVIGDVHGEFDIFQDFLNRLESNDKGSIYILVGDIIDRGPKTPEMVKWAIENITSSGKYQMVIGNHEFEKIDWWDRCAEYAAMHMDTQDNNVIAFECSRDNYDFVESFKESGHTGDEVKEAIDFFKTLKYYKDITVNGQRFVIVHANLPYSAIDEDGNNYYIQKDLKLRQKDFIVWDRDADGFDKIPDTILVNGHTPTVLPEAFPFYLSKNPKYGKIINTKNRYNIDCGLVFKEEYPEANLAALRLDDLQEFYYYE